jgi:hypothetical protein
MSDTLKILLGVVVGAIVVLLFVLVSVEAA